MTPSQAIAVLRSIPTHDAMQAEAVEMAVIGLLRNPRKVVAAFIAPQWQAWQGCPVNVTDKGEWLIWYGREWTQYAPALDNLRAAVARC